MLHLQDSSIFIFSHPLVPEALVAKFVVREPYHRDVMSHDALEAVLKALRVRLRHEVVVVGEPLEPLAVDAQQQ